MSGCTVQRGVEGGGVGKSSQLVLIAEGGQEVGVVCGARAPAAARC